MTKIYEENNVNFNLIENEPIDILIKYIDLRDQNLKRKEIHQIEKDYDNEELKYSIRSVLINIPWIRKIFILMPNEKVRYFKDYKLIKNKIIYVKDRDLLGYDSSDSNSIQFNIWKMDKFGISTNFIIMDDDCFIGKKLAKSDFFYVDKEKVVPSIVTSTIAGANIAIGDWKKGIILYVLIVVIVVIALFIFNKFDKDKTTETVLTSIK